MPFTSALLGDFFGGPGGFNETSDRLRQENQKQGEEQRTREAGILQHLSTSDDPQIRAAAVTGMLTGPSSGKSTGLDKWFGKQQSHPAFPIISQLVGEGHQPFLSPAEEQARKTQSQYEGEITGTANAYKNLTGEDLPPDQLRRMVETRFRGVARPFTTHPTSVKYTDEGGEVKTAGVIYDPNDRQYYNSDGKTPFPYADSIVGESRSGHFNEPNAFRGAYMTTIPDKDQPTGYARVHWTADGKEIGRSPTTAPPPTSDFLGPPTQTSTGLQLTTKGGTMVPVKTAKGAPPPEPGVTPQTSAEQLNAQMRLINSAMQQEVPNFGMLGRAAPAVKASLDKHAQAAGFKDYADLEKQHGDAVRAVGSRVQPPAPPKEEKGKKPAAKAGGIDVDKVLDFLKKRPQE